MLDVVFGESANVVELKEIRSALGAMDVSGTLYLGYPVLATADARIFVDALLVSESHGLVAFDVSSRPTADGFAELSDRQGDIYASIHNKLNEHRELRKGRSLAVAINVVTCHPALERTEKRDDVIACPPAALPDVLGEFDPVEEKYLRPLRAAIQRVSTLRPPRRRQNVKKENSRGAVIKRIEREIANLDRWQKRAAVEYADGPQRVRGLAGSGKTVVLALKAAYLHVRHPEWKIAVTFYTRSLHQQFQDLIRRFVFDQIKDEPDWSNLEVLHAWGSGKQPRRLFSGLRPLWNQSANLGDGQQCVRRVARVRRRLRRSECGDPGTGRRARLRRCAGGRSSGPSRGNFSAWCTGQPSHLVESYGPTTICKIWEITGCPPNASCSERTAMENRWSS